MLSILKEIFLFLYQMLVFDLVLALACWGVNSGLGIYRESRLRHPRFNYTNYAKKRR
jgi:hypothetical protein